MRKKQRKTKKYLVYVKNQMSKCNELVNETVPWEYNELIPIIIFKMSVFSHYHTLNLLENFVNK